ncbi:hypothetical protein A3Q56_08297, partial [Intoshia linei]
MPKGKKKVGKGGYRQFTDIDTLREQTREMV